MKLNKNNFAKKNAGGGGQEIIRSLSSTAPRQINGRALSKAYLLCFREARCDLLQSKASVSVWSRLAAFISLGLIK